MIPLRAPFPYTRASMNRFVLLVGLWAAAPLTAQQPPTFEVETHADLSYNPAKDADPVRHKLDLYVPKGAKNFPVMMFVHGGSWKSGNKEMYAGLGRTFAKQGVGTAIINYRLTKPDNTVKHPDHIHDVAKAFLWVRDNAAKYGGDKDRLYVSGHSAGGHLVALLATDESYLKAEGCDVKNIHGVMALSGVYTVQPVIPLIQQVFSKDADVCMAASPVAHISGKLPPFLLAYGDKDFPTMDKMAEDFGMKLKAAKGNVDVMKIDQRNHFTIIINVAANAADPLTKAMVAFVQGKK